MICNINELVRFIDILEMMKSYGENWEPLNKPRRGQQNTTASEFRIIGGFFSLSQTTSLGVFW